MDSGIELVSMESEGERDSRQISTTVYKRAPDSLTRKSRLTKDIILPELPKVIDDGNGKRYFRGRLLGKGGFARVYEVTDMSTNKMYALKVVFKARLSRSSDKYSKINQEIDLHKTLRHRYVVGFHGHFEDEQNVYILLELCSRKSLVQMLKTRGKLTDPEVRYLMHQAVQACAYLHSQRVIHRDIKVGNFFINQNMELRLGDFGLATRLKVGEKKIRTMCGTPNYIAPEVLSKEGHSYEVDTWALGCVMYTLLVGRPPFETKSLRETYQRIRENDYVIPTRVSPASAHLIQRLLHADPNQRPPLAQLQEDVFFKKGFFPASLPISACSCTPKWSEYEKRPNFIDQRKESIKSLTLAFTKQIQIFSDAKEEREEKKTVETDKDNNVIGRVESEVTSGGHSSKDTKPDCGEYQVENEHINKVVTAEELYTRLSSCLECMKRDLNKDTADQCNADTRTMSKSPNSEIEVAEKNARNEDQCTHVRGQLPKKLLITKWVDYSNKYGFGAQLSDGSVVVRFNDCTKIALSTDKRDIQYCNNSNKVCKFLSSSVPNVMEGKVTLLTYFANYMDRHLLKGGDPKEECDQRGTSIPYVDVWFRTETTMVMYLSNGTLQVNFFNDHTKVVLIPASEEVLFIYINEQRESSTFLFSQLSRGENCTSELHERLCYCKAVLKKIMEVSSQN